MSLLPIKPSSGKEQTLAKIIPGSVNFHVLLLKAIPPKITKSGKYGPGYISVVTLQEERIPYVFKQPFSRPGFAARNLISKPLENVPDLVLSPLRSTSLLSIFDPDSDLLVGEVYRLEGVYLDAYLGMVDKGGVEMVMSEPEIRPVCARLTLAGIKECIERFPFSLRSISIARDVPGSDRIQYAEEPKTYYFFHAKVGSRDDTPGTICGVFMPPVEGNQVETSFRPFNKERGCFEQEVQALTGGRNNEGVDKVQFFVQQNDEGSKQSIFKTFTRVLFTSGLCRMQLDWSKMGALLVPYLAGDAYCTVDREQSKDLVGESDYDGVLAVNMTFVPDMREVARRAGFKISWASVSSFDNSQAKVVPCVNLHGFRLETAINIMQVGGNVLRYIEKGAERDWVEFRVLTNMPIDDDERRAELIGMSEANLVAELKNKKYYPGSSIYVAIFASCTSLSPVHISDYVAFRGEPAVAAFFEETKKAKVIEE